jgi:DNA-directed RNA polymerase beta' subunit
MHCPGSIEAVAELQQLMNVENNLVGAASNKPSMGLVQDSLLAARCFTMRNTFLDRAQVMQLLMTVPTVSFKAGFRLPQPCILRPRALWSGKQLVSLLLPQSLNLSATAPFMPEEEKETRDLSTPSDTRVLIRGGTLLSGILEKGTLGNKHGSIVHIINNDIGAVEARVFLEEMQAMMHYYFAEIRGFSIGIGDMMASAETKKEVRHVLEKTRGTIATIVDEWERTKRAEKVGLGGGGAANGVNDVAKEKRKRDEGRFEAQVNRVLNQARDQAGRVASASLPVNGNNLKLIVTSGSKGSDINIAQMVGSVGQQNVDGQRVPCGLRDRALPHANWHDLKDIESRGFVSGSFVDGLTATEQFCHAMGGREGLIDTAVKTSRIGYIQRRLVKAMEDVSVTHDRTVRNSIGDVVQFVYGADDMDGAAFEWQEVPLLALSNADIEQRYSFSSSSSSSLAFVGSARVRSALIDASSATSVAMRSEMQTLLYLRDVMRESLPTDDERWPLPVHVERLVRTAQQQFGCERATESDLDPLVALQQLETLRNNCVRMFDPIAARSAPFSSDNALSSSPSKTINTRWERMHSSLIFFMMQVHGLLSPRRAMEHYHLSAAAFGWLVEQIERRLLQAKINAGEATGTLAAQSIGEPATQMTFNTFHYAGISEKNVTLGVPRLEEIIRVTRQVATPCMTLHLLYEPPSAALYADKQRRQQFDERLAVRAKALAESLPSLTIQSLLCATRASPAEIFTQQSAPALIRQLVDVWRATQHPLFAASAAATALGDAVPFFLCLHFSLVALHRRQISVSTIAAAIAAHFEGHVAVMFSDDNANSGYRSSDSGVSRPEEDDSVPIVLQMYKTELFDTLAALAADEKADAEKLNNEPAESAVSTVLEKAFANDDKKTLRLACEFDDAWRRAGIDGCMPLVLKQLEAEVLALPIDGVDGISGASARRQPCLLYDQNTGERVDAFAEWIVETDGSNLLDSFALEGVDHRLTTCNHPLEVYTALGIEAVRECLVRELRKVLTFDGSYVNYRHLSLLADVMTHGGSVMAINRFGLNRRQTGPLMRCTLEESVQMLMDAGIYSEFDPTTGPSERVALGRLVEHGTGTNFQVLKTKEGAASAASTALAPLRQPILPFVNRARISPFALVSRDAQFESHKIGQAVVDSAAAPAALGGTKAKALDASVIGVNPFAASRAAVTALNADDSAKKNEQILGQAVHEKVPSANRVVERRIGNFVFRSPFANDNKSSTTASPLSSKHQTLLPRNPFAASTTGATSTSITQNNIPILSTAAIIGTKRAQPSNNSISGYVPSTPVRRSVKRVRIAATCVVGEDDHNLDRPFSQITITAENNARAFKPSTPVRKHQQ